MHTTHRSTLFALIALIAIIAPAAPRAAGDPSSTPPPTITALQSPADGEVVQASSSPTFSWIATPGGRFRVQFSSSRSPFIPTLDSGRRATPGDRYKPSAKEWRLILGLAGVTNTVSWRAIALHMSPAQVTAVPISSFTIQR